MVEASPKIASESPQSLNIPTFTSNALLLSFGKSQTFSTEPNPSLLDSALMSILQKTPCKCPQLLICDDDSFQTMYYQVLLTNLFSSEEDFNKKPPLKFELFNSGEELISRYVKIKHCGCKSLLLVITDYSMGKEKLNGVQTIASLRKNGFLGTIILRTSETKKYLKQQNPKFLEMLDNGFIDYYLDKGNVKEAKETIKQIIKAKVT